MRICKEVPYFIAGLTERFPTFSLLSFRIHLRASSPINLRVIGCNIFSSSHKRLSASLEVCCYMFHVFVGIDSFVSLFPNESTMLMISVTVVKPNCKLNQPTTLVCCKSIRVMINSTSLSEWIDSNVSVYLAAPLPDEDSILLTVKSRLVATLVFFDYKWTKLNGPEVNWPDAETAALKWNDSVLKWRHWNGHEVGWR